MTSVASAQSLPLDKLVKTGRLTNGLTYYIRKNTEPQKRATLYLVVKAGSILENDDQQGLAHFIEHMSFNGTKNFPKNELINYLQRSGIRFGADLNAYTGFDETVYQLPIPTDKPDILKHGLQILRDWAQDATLDPAEINSERGVILEEKRLRMGAQQRVQDQTLPVVLNDSRYVNRLPIGTDEVLKNFKPAVIRSFYKDWYRPNLQAVIIVGDIDVTAIETQIKTLFSDLKNPIQPKLRTVYAIPLTGKNQFKTITDSEIPQTSVDISIKFKERINKTEADFRKSLITNLFSSMFSSRLAESAKKPDAPFLKLSGGYGSMMGGLDALSIELVPKKCQLKNGFISAWTIIEGIKRNGFIATELQRSKQSLLSQMQAALKEKDKQSSTSLADQYKTHFLKGEAATGIETENKLVNEILPGITLAEINAAAKMFLKATDRDIIITGPESEKTIMPVKNEVDGWINTVENATIKPYTETTFSNGLITNLPPKGKIVSEKRIPEIGVMEWMLSNGAKIVLKPTDFKHDEISFLALSPGGTSLYNNQDYESAANAAGIVASFGLGEYDNISLPKILNGKQVSIQPFISDRVEGLQGGSSVKDLHTAMELLHLYFTSPRKDTALFAKIIRNSAERIANRYTDPDAIFSDTVSAVLGGYNPRRTGPTLDKLKSIELDKAVQIYKERFANAGDFTFFFVGNINSDSLKSYAEQYIGSLPSSGFTESAKDLGIHIPSGKIAKTVNAGKEDKATVRMVFSGNYEFNPKNNLSLNALQEILQYRLTERLRETEGGVYTPSAQMSNNKYPTARYSFTVGFGCAPANVEKLISATLDEIRKLKENGISAVDLQKFKAEELRQNELAAKDNGFWLNYISGQYLNQEDPLSFLKLNEAIEKLDTATLQQAAKTFFNEDNYVRLVLLPKE
ncbi:peptidase M16 [Pedobacter ginsenosidimutans]|uniref:Peptidase M16 n=1 Tax=Pedobacter ginsenosidimutans TaxID=687842 RepID=A0A0T5VRC3_9SPHI|nr:peptidase M16 [Pedobacter ginsenosidimutans]